MLKLEKEQTMNKVKIHFHDTVEGGGVAMEPVKGLAHGEAGLCRLTGRRLHACQGGWGHWH